MYGRAECFGAEASAFVEGLLPPGTEVRYRLGTEERDRYGRALAYVWLRDGRFLNRLLVERGYAQPLTIPPNVDYADRFGADARSAREAGRGLWGRAGCAAASLAAVIREVLPDGVRLACEVSGSGPALVMVHGAGSARWGFDLLRPHLEHRFTVVAADRRGAATPPTATRYDLELDDRGRGRRAARVRPRARPVRALLRRSDRRGRRRTGGRPRPPGALRAPDGRRARRCRSGSTGSMRWWPPATASAALLDFLRDIGGYTDAEIAAMRGTPVWDARLATMPTAVREMRAENAYRLPIEALARLAVPTLLLVGSRSPDWARRSTEAYAEAIPGATVVTLDGQGHGANAAAPELVAAELLRFLRGPPARRDLLVLADDLPGRVGGVHEVRRLAVAQGVVVVVVLGVTAVDAAAAEGSDGAAELLGDRAVDRQRARGRCRSTSCRR